MTKTKPIILISTDPPASVLRPAFSVDGELVDPTDSAQKARDAVMTLRQELYSGQISPNDWRAAEQILMLSRFGVSGRMGGSAKGRSKARGGRAYYLWIRDCRKAKAEGRPMPAKPVSSKKDTYGLETESH